MGGREGGGGGGGKKGFVSITYCFLFLSYMRGPMADNYVCIHVYLHVCLHVCLHVYLHNASVFQCYTHSTWTYKRQLRVHAFVYLQ